MNIIQMHSKIRTYLDNENSPRFPPQLIDEMINTAIGLILDDRYDNEKKSQREKSYSFQSSRKLRDQLYTLIARSDEIPCTNGFIPTGVEEWPTDFLYLIAPTVNVSGTTAVAMPLTYEEEAIIEQDPKRRPSIIYPPRVYFIEQNTGIKILWGTQGQLNSAIIEYIKVPATVTYGTEGTLLVALSYAILYTAVTTVTISKRTTGNVHITYLTYQPGQTFSFTDTDAYRYVPTAGIFVYGMVSCDLPTNMHEEVTRRAAAMIAGTVENFDRKKDLLAEDKN